MAKNQSEPPNLFGNMGETRVSTPSRGKACHALSCNWSIGQLLGRGALTAPNLGELTDVPFLDSSSACIPLTKGAFPQNWISELKECRRNLTPIAVRLHQRWTAKRMETWSKAICLDEVEALVFESEKDLKNFQANRFADYDLDEIGLLLITDPATFGGKNSPIKPAEPSTAAENLIDARSSFRTSDSHAALASVLLSTAPGEQDWMTAFQSIWAADPSHGGLVSSWLHAIENGLRLQPKIAQTLDEGLLSATAAVLCKSFPISAGWPASVVLQEVLDELPKWVNQDVLSVERDVITTWEQRCRSVIDAREDLPDMQDDRRVVLRAVMLLLVRGELEALTPSAGMTNRSRPIGKCVRSLALCLAAVRTGLRACPSGIKHSSTESVNGTLLRAIGRKFVENIDVLPKKGAKSATGSLKVEWRSIQTLSSEWVLSYGKHEFFRKPVDYDPVLKQVESMARQMGIEFEEVNSSLLRTSVEVENGTHQSLYLSLKHSLPDASTFARFSSVVKELSLNKPKNGSLLSRAAVNRLPKDYLVDLLEKNGDKNMSCRFALCHELGAVITLADQLTSSLDEQELRQHVHHVAGVAAQNQ
jgi:hypothetical protein